MLKARLDDEARLRRQRVNEVMATIAGFRAKTINSRRLDAELMGRGAGIVMTPVLEAIYRESCRRVAEAERKKMEAN